MVDSSKSFFKSAVFTHPSDTCKSGSFVGILQHTGARIRRQSTHEAFQRRGQGANGTCPRLPPSLLHVPPSLINAAEAPTPHPGSALKYRYSTPSPPESKMQAYSSFNLHKTSSEVQRVTTARGVFFSDYFQDLVWFRNVKK